MTHLHLTALTHPLLLPLNLPPATTHPRMMPHRRPRPRRTLPQIFPRAKQSIHRISPLQLRRISIIDRSLLVARDADWRRSRSLQDPCCDALGKGGRLATAVVEVRGEEDEGRAEDELCRRKLADQYSTYKRTKDGTSTHIARNLKIKNPNAKPQRQNYTNTCREILRNIIRIANH